MSHSGEYWRPCLSSKTTPGPGAQVRQVIEAGEQPGQVPADGDTAVLVPLGALDHHHRVPGVDVAAAQAAGLGRAQARAEDQPEDDRDRVLAERAAVLGGDGVGGRKKAASSRR